MSSAAFRATYSDWRIVKGRKVVQVVFELPLESADEAYQCLGGMPIAAHEVWCGIARLSVPDADGGAGQDGTADSRPRNPGGRDEVAPSPSNVLKSVPRQRDEVPTAGADHPRRSFNEMPVPQQAGMLCQERAFRLFLAEKFDMPMPDPDEAADVIRHHCKVKSRAEITKDNVGWSEIVLAYRLWQREPEFV